MNLSRNDFLDRLSAYEWIHKTIHRLGHEITYKAIAIDDIIQVLDDIMSHDDIIQIVSKKDQLKLNILKIEDEIENNRIKLKRLKANLEIFG